MSTATDRRERFRAGYSQRVEAGHGRGFLCDCAGCNGHRRIFRGSVSDFAVGYMFAPDTMRGFRSRIRWVSESGNGHVFVGMTSAAGWDVSDGRVAEVVNLCPYGHVVPLAVAPERGPVDRVRVPLARLARLRGGEYWRLGWADCSCHGCVLDRELGVSVVTQVQDAYKREAEAWGEEE